MDARLTGACSTPSGKNGAVEVLTSLGWLKVCSRYRNEWDDRERTVFCKQLGYESDVQGQSLS